MILPPEALVHGALCVPALAATLFPAFRGSSKWVRFFDFPRIQIATLLALLLASAGWAWPEAEQAGGLAALLAAALAYQSYWIFPFTRLGRKEVLASGNPDKARTFRLMIYNVRMENRNHKAFLERTRQCDPDLILANEVDQEWVRKIDALGRDYPYQVLQPQGDTYGMALYSRLELAEAEVLFQVEENIPSIHCLVVLKDGSTFDFHGIHPKPPDLKNDTENRDAELVLTGIAIKKKNMPALVAGDLNDVAWSHTTRLFKRLSGMLDPRTGRGFFNTYSVFFPFFRYPLDHLFITSHFRLVKLKRLPACGSDHFPVFAELEFIPERKAEQPVEKADAEDIEHAAEILEEAAQKGYGSG